MLADLHLARGRAFSKFHKCVTGAGNGSALRAMHGAPMKRKENTEVDTGSTSMSSRYQLTT